MNDLLTRLREGSTPGTYGAALRAEAAAEIARLREALRPFAASAWDRDNLSADWEIRVPLRQLRQARAALDHEQGSVK